MECSIYFSIIIYFCDIYPNFNSRITKYYKKTYKNITGLYDYPQNEEDYIELTTNIKRRILMIDERFENKHLIGLTIPEIFVRNKNQYFDKSSLTPEYVKLLEYIKTSLE